MAAKEVFEKAGKTPNCPVWEKANWEDGPQHNLPLGGYNPYPSIKPSAPAVRDNNTVICTGCNYVMLFRV